jgi:hypothetical protein
MSANSPGCLLYSEMRLPCPDLHLALEQVLGDDDTSMCANLHAGSTILTQAYGRAIERFAEGQGALAAALSAYNTGASRPDLPTATSLDTTVWCRR